MFTVCELIFSEKLKFREIISHRISMQRMQLSPCLSPSELGPDSQGPPSLRCLPNVAQIQKLAYCWGTILRTYLNLGELREPGSRSLNSVTLINTVELCRLNSVPHVLYFYPSESTLFSYPLQTVVILHYVVIVFAFIHLTKELLQIIRQVRVQLN